MVAVLLPAFHALPAVGRLAMLPVSSPWVLLFFIRSWLPIVGVEFVLFSVSSWTRFHGCGRVKAAGRTIVTLGLSNISWMSFCIIDRTASVMVGPVIVNARDNLGCWSPSSSGVQSSLMCIERIRFEPRMRVHMWSIALPKFSCENWGGTWSKLITGSEVMLLSRL